MDFVISSAYAQAADPAAQARWFRSCRCWCSIVIMAAMMFFMLIRPQMKRAKEQRTMLAGLAKGDEVVTNGGIAGRISELGDTFLTLEVATNVSIKVQKSAIGLVLPKGSLKSL